MRRQHSPIAKGKKKNSNRIFEGVCVVDIILDSSNPMSSNYRVQ